MRTIKLLTLPLVLVSLAGCEFFDNDDDDGVLDDGTVDFADTDEGETGPPPPPTTGFRVFPRFMLEPVPAIVTIEVDQDPQPCELDDDQSGAYVCDAGDVVTATATLRVDRDGFETAVRHPEIKQGIIDEIDIHLAIEGGPTGVWSECTLAAGVASCEVVCEAQMSTCAVASCDTMYAEWPIATVQTFDDPECANVLEGLVPSCDEEPVSKEVAAIRCCCAS